MAEARKPGRKRISAAGKVEAQRLFETTSLNQAAIARRVGICDSSLSRMAVREGWGRSRDVADRHTLIGGIRAKIETEIDRAERAFAAGEGTGEPLPADAERAARTLASLVRTLRELAKFDEEQARASTDGDADDMPADIDGFRDALADRLDRLRRGDD